MLLMRQCQATLMLAAAAALLHGQSLGLGQAAVTHRWTPRSPRPRQGNGQIPGCNSGAAHAAARGRKVPFSALSARAMTTVEDTSSRRRNSGEPPPLTSSLAMLPIVAADLGLRELLHCCAGWSFPSGVAGMVALFAGLVGLDRVAPRYAERAVRLLEPGSAQFMACLPVAFVPGIVSWMRFPIAGLLGSTSSLSEAVVAATKLEGARADISRIASPPVMRAGAVTKLQVVLKATALLLSVAGGWLVNLGSAAAILTALSPSSPSPGSSTVFFSTAATTAAAASAPSPSLKPSPTEISAASFFNPRLVRRLGVGTAGLGALSALPLSLFLFSGDNSWLCMLLAGSAMCGTWVMSIGLATLFGYAAGRLAVSPEGAFARSCPPWMSVLLPLATSVAAPVAVGWTIGLAFFRVWDLRGVLQAAVSVAGDGDLMFHLLSPAVLSFAAPLFRMRGLIFSNAGQVIGGSVVCASTALFGIALGSRLLGIPKAFKMALLAKSQAEANKSLAFKLRTALRSLVPRPGRGFEHPSPTVAAALGAYAPKAIAGALVLTGVLGATFGTRALDVLGVKNRMIRELVQGGPVNVLGMAAISDQDKLRNGFDADTSTRDVSTAAMILTGVAGAALVNIPPVRSVLLSIALGKGTAAAAVP